MEKFAVVFGTDNMYPGQTLYLYVPYQWLCDHQNKLTYNKLIKKRLHYCNELLPLYATGKHITALKNEKAKVRIKWWESSISLEV